MLIPSFLFYGTLELAGVRAALLTALAFCFGALAWRLATRRPCSALLWITAVGLTAKTVFSLATHSTAIYFLQPAATDVLIAMVFLVSLLRAPVVGRLANDFYPMTADIAARPRVQRLFWHLTLLWAVLCLLQAGATVWLLETMSLGSFVAARTIVTSTVAVGGAAATVFFAARIARREGLFGSHGAPVFA